MKERRMKHAMPYYTRCSISLAALVMCIVMASYVANGDCESDLIAMENTPEYQAYIQKEDELFLQSQLEVEDNENSSTNDENWKGSSELKSLCENAGLDYLTIDGNTTCKMMENGEHTFQYNNLPLCFPQSCTGRDDLADVMFESKGISSIFKCYELSHEIEFLNIGGASHIEPVENNSLRTSGGGEISNTFAFITALVFSFTIAISESLF